ncbi:TPA: restriction endonuclease subunit S [Haemophilus influenzae]|nr:restriction endonuclease subunit S [Haemophilus influenzae]
MNKIKLKEIIEYQKGAVFKSQDYQKQGVGIVRVSDFEGNSINLDNIYYISNEIADKNKKVRLKPYDVVITTVGATAGNFIRVPIEADGYLLNQNTVRLRTKENNKWDQIYLFYALKYKNFQEFLLLGAQGSAQPSIVLDQILDAEIAYPDNRRETAKKLFSIDQKIHLNTQINQTLEQIAQALFKSWFVDFDPVRAKVQALSDGLSLEQAELAAMQAISGKTPKELTALSQTQPDRYAELAETAKAFPCEMVEVDGVEVPKGWKIQYLKDICNIVYGKNLPTTKLIKEGYPVFGGNGVIGYYDKFLYETPQTLVSCRGAASGKVLYSLSYSFVTNNSLVIEHEKSGLSYFYIYETLKLQNLTELTSGSAQPQMTIANMAAVQILVPSEKINEVCKKYLGTLYNQIYQNNIENETLANTRDLLLPKLLKGEV